MVSRLMPSSRRVPRERQPTGPDPVPRLLETRQATGDLSNASPRVHACVRVCMFESLRSVHACKCVCVCLCVLLSACMCTYKYACV